LWVILIEISIQPSSPDIDVTIDNCCRSATAPSEGALDGGKPAWSGAGTMALIEGLFRLQAKNLGFGHYSGA
jgi:hypothetical protein